MPVIRGLSRLKYLNLGPQLSCAFQRGPSPSSKVLKAVSAAGQGRALFARRERTLEGQLRLPYLRLGGRRAVRRRPLLENSAGVRSSKELCGRLSLKSVRHCSSFLRVSSMSKKTSTFKHSSRKRPLKLSTNPFSTGLPGRMKSSFTPFW
jgi:hypothetical protein